MELRVACFDRGLIRKRIITIEEFYTHAWRDQEVWRFEGKSEDY